VEGLPYPYAIEHVNGARHAGGTAYATKISPNPDKVLQRVLFLRWGRHLRDEEALWEDIEGNRVVSEDSE
jgi:hypothetical protein